MKIILGERLYERKYPQYTKEQKERWADKDCLNYTRICAVLNMKCFDKYGCYMDKATPEQVKFIEDNTRGFFNFKLDELLGEDF